MAAVKYVKIKAYLVKTTDKAALYEIYKHEGGDTGFEFWIPDASNYFFRRTGGDAGYLYVSEKVFKSKWEGNASRFRHKAEVDEFYGDERYTYDANTRNFTVVESTKKYVPPKKPSIGKIDVTSDTAGERRKAKGWNYDREMGMYVSVNALLAMEAGAYTAARVGTEFGVSAAFVYWAFETSEKHHVNKESSQLYDFFCTYKIREFKLSNPDKWLLLIKEFYGPNDKVTKREEKNTKKTSKK